MHMALLLKRGVLSLLAMVCWQALGNAAWEEHELDRLPVGGAFPGDSLHLEDGVVVATWNRMPEEGNATVWQSQWDGGFSTPVVVVNGGNDWWGGTAFVIGGDEYLAVQRPGPEGYGYYLQGLSAGAGDLQWLSGLVEGLYYDYFLATDDTLYLAYSGIHLDDELRTLRIHSLIPGGETTTMIGPRAIWPSLAKYNGEIYVGYHNMLNYGKDLGPSYGRFELSKLTDDGFEVVYQDQTRVHNGLHTKLVVDEEAGVLWFSYVNPSRYTYPPGAPEEDQRELMIHEIILTRWDGVEARQNSITVGPGRFYHTLLLLDGTPHVYYVDQPQATIFDSWIGDGYMELDTVRPYSHGGWIPAADPLAQVGEDGTVVLTFKAVEFSTGDGGLIAMTKQL